MSRIGGVSFHHMLHIHPCIKRPSKQPMELISLSKGGRHSEMYSINHIVFYLICSIISD
jgi:hypothetical protein